MNPKIRLLAGQLAKAGSIKDKGDFGEACAKAWFRQRGLDFFHFPQSPETMPTSLARRGGKRPDFAVELQTETVYLDAKYHPTSSLTHFAIENSELEKLSQFRVWVKEDIGDHGARDVRDSPGRGISLLKRDGAWFDQHPPTE